MFIYVLYWKADKGKERSAGSIGACWNCKGIRQSAGRNVRLLLCFVRKAGAN